MKTLALTSTVFVLTAAGVMAQQSDIEFLRARADAHERKISQLERELNQLKSNSAQKQHPKAVPVPTVETSASGEYIVKKGDMLGRIAKRFDTSVAAIKSANGLRNDNIRIGQKLRIPGAATAPPVAKSKAPAPSPAAKPLNTSSSHVVKSGETFYSIARKHNVSVTSLMAANPAVTPARLQVGRTLKIDANARPASTSKSRSVAKAPANKPKSKPVSRPTTKVAEHVDPPKPKPARTKDVVRKAPADSKPAATSEPEIRTVIVHKQVSYGQFASQYGASTNQLNELNGLSLSKNTMLAVGSELYVPKD